MARALRSLLPVAFFLMMGCISVSLQAQARFDLAGPKIDVRVTRDGVTLPIAAVPNLQAGDQLWLHPAFPPTQSVRYLLIVVFLRGTTNPPPDDWFTRIDTSKKTVREEGVTLKVPAEAQQALLFLAPETGGDFTTLRSAVKGSPGIFVRASQDLTEAGFEQARIERYLAEIKQVPAGDSVALQQHSDLLARTLNLKPNPDCFKKSPDLQYTCLTQTGTQTLLDDGHGQTVVAALSTGSASDFIQAASYTGAAGGGAYSAYVGAIVDLVRLTSNLHTAQFKYIPAISFPDPEQRVSETLNLRLNTPPSFHNPKSVIVIGLPAVQKATLPPLRPADPNHIACLLDPHMVLPIEGAPLVFSTAYAHDLTLHLNGGAGAGSKDLPIMADPYQGGLTLDANPTLRRVLPLIPEAAKAEKSEPVKPATSNSGAQGANQPTTGTIEGYWGFDRYVGPTLPLQNVPGRGWRIVSSTDAPEVLIAGQPNHVQLAATGTACVRSIVMQPGDAKVDWKQETSPGAKEPGHALELTLNLQKASAPGEVNLAIEQFGDEKVERVGTKSFAPPAKIEALRLHAGDLMAGLSGSNVDQVKTLTLAINGKEFTYLPSDAADAVDSARTNLTLALAKETKPPNLKVNERVSATIHLEDGRTVDTSTIVLPSRPSISILTRRLTQVQATPIQLASAQDLPLGAELTFFLKSQEKFQRNEQIEIASKDSDPSTGGETPVKTTLTVAAGSLVMQDSHTILATFDPLKTFGPSTYGPFRVRAVTADGTRGEWLPLATIVRLPTLTALECPVAKEQNCQLTGSALYLIDSISADADFSGAVAVPEGFVEPSLTIPRPQIPSPAPSTHQAPATFFLKLRDDPSSADAVTLPMQIDAATTAVVKAKLTVPGTTSVR